MANQSPCRSRGRAPWRPSSSLEHWDERYWTSVPVRAFVDTRDGSSNPPRTRGGAGVLRRRGIRLPFHSGGRPAGAEFSAACAGDSCLGSERPHADDIRRPPSARGAWPSGRPSPRRRTWICGPQPAEGSSKVAKQLFLRARRPAGRPHQRLPDAFGCRCSSAASGKTVACRPPNVATCVLCCFCNCTVPRMTVPMSSVAPLPCP